MKDHNFRRKGIFKPKKRGSLREQLKPAIGKTFTFQFLWVGDKGEAYEGQDIFSSIDNNDSLDCFWIPDEDIEWI